MRKTLGIIAAADMYTWLLVKLIVNGNYTIIILFYVTTLKITLLHACVHVLHCNNYYHNNNNMVIVLWCTCDNG